MIGEFRDYKVQESNINKMKLLFKPVFFIQKIFFSLLMDIAFLFSFSFIASILEIHLKDFDVSSLFIAFCFMLQSTIYLLASLSGGYIFKNIDERYLMTVGCFLVGISFMMLGPCSLIFPKKVMIIIAAMPLNGLGQSLTYSNYIISV